MSEKKLELNDFVLKMDQAKKQNPLDLSSDQDLTIAIMNLVSIEEHFIFSGAKTGNTAFYDMIKEVRSMRKELMEKVIKNPQGETWCLSKHLLGASYRLMEVGTKQQSLGNTKEAYDLFNKAFDLYSLFWGLNMGFINSENVKKIDDSEISKPLTKESSLKNNSPVLSSPIIEVASKGSILGKLGGWVKQAVDCCRE